MRNTTPAKNPTVFKKSYATVVLGASNTMYNNHITLCKTNNNNMANELQVILIN